MTAQHKVLVVEDEPVIRTALRRLLERHEYQVEEAGSVKEAVEQHRMDDFDIVISDLRLPGAPGTDLIKSTRTPVLIMTSYSSLRSAIDSMKMGAVDYISKPFEHEEMLETVAHIIKERTVTTRPEKTGQQTEEPPVPGMIGSCPQML